MNFKQEKPYFTNEEGFEWYLDKEHTEFAKTSSSLQSNNGLKDVGCFIVKKDDKINYLMINSKQEILIESHYGTEHASDTFKTRITALKILQNYE